jgi:DNA-directed RNA polymerase specialized sigma24 family protein
MLRQRVEHPDLTTGDAVAAVALAERHARRLARRYRLQRADRDDARQAILLALVARSPRFQAERGNWPAFASIVARHAAADLARERRRSARFEQLGPEHESAILEISPDLAIDFRAALARLPHERRSLVNRIAEAGGITQAQRHGDQSPASFYRALRDLRLRLTAAGLAPSQPGRRAPIA